MTRRNMTAFWLRLAGVVTAFSLVLMLAAALIGHGMQKRVIAYITSPQEIPSIEIVDVDRTIRIKVLDLVGAYCLAWSHSGNKIGVIQNETGGPGGIYIIDLFDETQFILTRSTSQPYTIQPYYLYNSLAWSPDDRAIVFIASSQSQTSEEIVEYDFDQHELKQLAEAPTFIHYSNLHFSANGQDLIFMSSDDETFSIDRLNIHDLQKDRLLSQAGHSFALAISSDGKHIVYNVSQDKKSELYLMADTGNDIRFLTGDSQHASWSPDGENIAYQAYRDGDQEIYLTEADGSNQRQLTYNNWHDFLIGWSPDGRLITYKADSDNQIYVVDPNGHNERRVTSGWGTKWCPVWQP